MKSHKLNKSNTCIAGWYEKNTTLFDDLINFHKNNKQKTTTDHDSSNFMFRKVSVLTFIRASTDTIF